MATVTGTLRIDAFGSQVATSVPGTGQTAFSTTQSFRTNFGTSGTTTDEVNLWSSFTLTLAASTPQAVDLSALTDPYGGAVNLARVRRLVIKNRATAAGYNVTVSPGATNGWTALITGNLILPPSTSTPNDAGAVFVAPGATGWAVSSTSKTLTFDPGTNGPISVDVDIMGASA